MMPGIAVITGIILFSMYFSTGLVAQDTLPLVDTAAGAIQGVQAGGIRAFPGIPFAAPPVGALRFRPPAAVEPWTGVRTAREMPPVCPQSGDDGSVVGSEDCLYLNVWSRQDEAQAPVLVFIHGGANVQGSASVPFEEGLLYDGARIVRERPVVVVTVQYRLGALGYLVHPALSQESEHGSSGNYGLLDLVAALRWVQENIAAFGGDPSRVMIFGESAGALNTCMLMASPLAQGLFSSALMQSGGCRAAKWEDRLEEGTALAAELGCDSAECMRSLSATDIVAAQGAVPIRSDGTLAFEIGPVVDGWVLPDAPLTLIEEGRHNRAPLVLGANADETSRWVAPLAAAAYRLTLTRQFGAVLGPLVLREYPVEEFETPREALVAVTTDVQFVCPCRSIAAKASAAQAEPVFRYFFTHYPPAAEARGAFHGLELSYVFQHFDQDLPLRPSEGDLAVQRALLNYWVSLAASGTPNDGTAQSWPRYESGSDQYLELASEPRAGDGVRTGKCDFWERLGRLAGQEEALTEAYGRVSRMRRLP